MRFLEQMFFRRPRILNILHKLRVVNATSQTNDEELQALARYAKGAKVALEIGSYQGVSAAVIARSLASDGCLVCVDPWLGNKKRDNPGFTIFTRHIKRMKTKHKIQVIRDFSANALKQLPRKVDFAFIDGDHSWSGIETDWRIVSGRMSDGGVICLHDTAIPPQEPWRTFEACRFYNEVIALDPGFERIDTIYSMRVLRKRKT
jgi:predicted O-methyltransferase YrrM